MQMYVEHLDDGDVDHYGTLKYTFEAWRQVGFTEFIHAATLTVEAYHDKRIACGSPTFYRVGIVETKTLQSNPNVMIMQDTHIRT